MTVPKTDRQTDREMRLGTVLVPFGVSILYAFGSRGREIRDWLQDRVTTLSRTRSDVDVGVRPQQGVRWSVADKVRLAQTLEDFLGCDRVDLVVLPEADPFVAAEVVRGERLYAGDAHDADEYELYVLRRAGDLAPLEYERMALILGDRS